MATSFYLNHVITKPGDIISVMMRVLTNDNVDLCEWDYLNGIRPCLWRVMMYLCISADDVSMYHIFNWKNTSVFQETKTSCFIFKVAQLQKSTIILMNVIGPDWWKVNIGDCLVPSMSQLVDTRTQCLITSCRVYLLTSFYCAHIYGSAHTHFTNKICLSMMIVLK